MIAKKFVDSREKLNSDYGKHIFKNVNEKK